MTPRRSDVDLRQREITVRGKGGKARIVKIGHQAARSLDRYIRARSRRRQPREQGAAQCPAPTLSPRPWPSRRVNYRTMLNPRL
jgi:site-specific recombinase XerD